jgi:hypothetical protein
VKLAWEASSPGNSSKYYAIFAPVPEPPEFLCLPKGRAAHIDDYSVSLAAGPLRTKPTLWSALMSRDIVLLVFFA